MVPRLKDESIFRVNDWGATSARKSTYMVSEVSWVFEEGWVTMYNLLPGAIRRVSKFLNEKIANPLLAEN